MLGSGSTSSSGSADDALDRPRLALDPAASLVTSGVVDGAGLTTNLEHLGRVLDSKELDVLAVHDEVALLLIVVDRALVDAVGGVVLEEVRRVFHVAERVVDRRDFGALLLARRTAHETANAPKPGDAHLHHDC